MWRIPSPFFSDRLFTQTITTDTYIGDLHDYVNNPTAPVEVSITADGADIGEIIITDSFAPGSTFTFTCINGGRILGIGGDGGDGGANITGGSGTSAGGGQDGGDAISSVGFPVDVDIDDGFLMGGGGGGGGGAWSGTVGTDGDGGGGGGGGQGFTGGAGGLGGTGGIPLATDGTNGTRNTTGVGGDEGSTGASSGGNGGKYGSGGQTGKTTDLTVFQFLGFVGGLGGRAGNAFFPVSGAAAINYTGAKSEATLRSEGRLKGLTSRVFRPPYGASDQGNIPSESGNVSVAGANTTGVIFELNGSVTRGNLSTGGVNDTSRWLGSVSATEAAFFDIRERNGDGNGGAANPLTTSEDRDEANVTGGFLGEVNATPGNWSTLSSDRTQSISSSTGVEWAATLMEIRRNDVPGNPDDEIICSFYVLCVDENAV